MTTLLSEVTAFPTTVDVQDHGAKGDGATDDTAAINLALNAAPDGATVAFPATSAYYKISAALQVPRSNLIICGTSSEVEIQQTVWPNPVFDCHDVDNIQVNDLKLSYTGEGRLDSTVSGSSRGDGKMNLSAGVWANGSQIRVHNVRISGFYSGVYLSPWSTAAQAWTINGHTGNRIADIETESTDFGILYGGQTDLQIDGLYNHDNLDSSEGANPMHAVYGTGTPSITSTGIRIRNVLCRNCFTGHAVQIKYTHDGSVTNLFADTGLGLFNGIDLTDVILANHKGWNMTGDPSSGAWTLQQINGNSRVVASDIGLAMSADVRAVTLSGDDCRYRNFTIYSKRDGASPSDYDVQLQRGSRSQIDGMRICNIGTGQARALYIYGTDVSVRNLVCDNTANLFDIDSTGTGAVVIYDPAQQHRIGANTAYIGNVGGPVTFTLIRDDYTRSYLLASGSATMYPNPAMETVSRAEVTDATDITIGPAVTTPTSGLTHTVAVWNKGAGAMGTVTWDQTYALAGTFNEPSAGMIASVRFVWDATKWRQVMSS